MGTLRLTDIQNGGQWWKSITWAGEALRNAGFDVDMTRFGAQGSDALMRVVAGESDVSIALATQAAQAAKGRGAFRKGEALSIRGLARLIRPNQHYFHLVHESAGIR